MLPKIHRLRQRRDFTWVYQKGIRRSSLHLTLRGLKLRGDRANSPTLIGISISQKVSKKAVDRNRMKRQIRAAIRLLLPKFRPGWYLVIVVQPIAIECDYRQFLQELEQLFTDAEVINGD
ncbi:ribonuclease P protein component [Microcoleus sp. FACHB-1515]|uniref:ribonuclease P protein component n=1 Tax=Cyanophyceae TaxID=3028117 RepID=UPI001686E046|nr:ribonuclease P protein component [Microcoleus sp. FACHB-1515]MBD2092627.1 ribonuclease P protein component [Microcoleus sp. FACHB-1515]